MLECGDLPLPGILVPKTPGPTLVAFIGLLQASFIPAEQSRMEAEPPLHYGESDQTLATFLPCQLEKKWRLRQFPSSLS